MKHLKTVPLVYPALVLSIGSLIWTTWSILDLLGTEWPGFTVAAGADLIWGTVILAQARGLKIWKPWLVPAIGTVAVLSVAGFLIWHGVEKDNAALAVAGPFLPLGAKVVWMIALVDMRDPSELTDAERLELAEMERGLTFDEAKHRIEMRQREMAAELLMSEVSTDFDIELMRQDKTRELSRRRPLELPSGDARRITRGRTDAHHTPRITDARDALTTPAAPHPGIPAVAGRTDALDETPDGGSDTPPMRHVPASAAAPHVGDAAHQLDGMSKAAAVRVMRDADPTASAPQISQRLAHHGIDASDAYVRTVLSRIKSQRPTDGGYL